jgi:hypothetical protein
MADVHSAGCTQAGSPGQQVLQQHVTTSKLFNKNNMSQRLLSYLVLDKEAIDKACSATCHPRQPNHCLAPGRLRKTRLP